VLGVTAVELRRKDHTSERSKMGDAAPDGRFEGNGGEMSDWQNLSIGVFKVSYWRELTVTGVVTTAWKATDNTEFSTGRTSDFRHLGLWPSECDSECELVIQPNSQTETRTL
jgi:hypothetical protein